MTAACRCGGQHLNGTALSGFTTQDTIAPSDRPGSLAAFILFTGDPVEDMEIAKSLIAKRPHVDICVADRHRSRFS
jgi:hypothetical protein